MFEAGRKADPHDPAVLDEYFINNLVYKVFHDFGVQVNGHLHIIYMFIGCYALGHKESRSLPDESQVSMAGSAAFFQVGYLARNFTALFRYLPFPC